MKYENYSNMNMVGFPFKLLDLIEPESTSSVATEDWSYNEYFSERLFPDKEEHCLFRLNADPTHYKRHLILFSSENKNIKTLIIEQFKDIQNYIFNSNKIESVSKNEIMVEQEYYSTEKAWTIPTWRLKGSIFNILDVNYLKLEINTLLHNFANCEPITRSTDILDLAERLATQIKQFDEPEEDIEKWAEELADRISLEKD